MVYGISWNPFRPSTGAAGSEFLSYGVKHLKSWIMSDEGQWACNAASFGPEHVQNVLSAIYVPALHPMAAPGDSCILAGFASGEVGLFVPPYPTRAGSTYALSKIFKAHEPGPSMTLTDGSMQCGGVRAIVLRSDYRTVLTGGADGHVVLWNLSTPAGAKADGTPLKGVRLTCRAAPGETAGPNRYKLAGPKAPLEDEVLPMVRSLDTHPLKDGDGAGGGSAFPEFIAGTDGCDIWEVDRDPRVLVEGHEDDVYVCAVHPALPHIFATACSSNRVRVWDARTRDVHRSASIGFACAGVAFSQEQYGAGCVEGWEPEDVRSAAAATAAFALLARSPAARWLAAAARRRAPLSLLPIAHPLPQP
jgi:microtubule-associated protein-like 5